MVPSILAPVLRNNASQDAFRDIASLPNLQTMLLGALRPHRFLRCSPATMPLTMVLVTMLLCRVCRQCFLALFANIASREALRDIASCGDLPQQCLSTDLWSNASDHLLIARFCSTTVSNSPFGRGGGFRRGGWFLHRDRLRFSGLSAPGAKNLRRRGLKGS